MGSLGSSSSHSICPVLQAVLPPRTPCLHQLFSKRTGSGLEGLGSPRGAGSVPHGPHLPSTRRYELVPQSKVGDPGAHVHGDWHTGPDFTLSCFGH